MFYWAKMYVSSLPSGDDYSLLPQTIVISILGFEHFYTADVHSEFAVMEVNRHEILSDKQRYHFFELPKLPNVDSIDTRNEKDLWLALFNAETEEELEKLVASGGEVMNQAVGAYHSITTDKQFQYLETLRTKARHDEALAISSARRQGAQAEREKLQGVIAERDNALANEKAENEKLRQQLTALQSGQKSRLLNCQF